MAEFIRRYPQVLPVLAIVAVGLSLASLVESVGMYHHARRAVAELERQASEALGG